MVTYYSSELKVGLKILYNKEPHSIILNEFIKPGKGQSFFRVKFKNLINRKLIERTCRSTEHFQSADILELVVLYIFNDRNNWIFMNKKNFEQIVIGSSVIKHINNWLLEQHEYVVTLWNNNPIAIDFANNFINLTVLNTAFSTNVDSIGNNSKLALLSSGATVQVPLFIKAGQNVKIDTRTGEYISKV